MKDIQTKRNGDLSMVDSIPHHDNERVVAFCSTEFLIGSVVRVEKLPDNFVVDLENGSPGALDDCLRPEGDLGFRRIVQGEAYLGMIEGQDPSEYRRITGNGFFETLPEKEN